jgi:hypothetical protein
MLPEIACIAAKLDKTIKQKVADGGPDKLGSQITPHGKDRQQEHATGSSDAQDRPRTWIAVSIESQGPARHARLGFSEVARRSLRA